MKAATAERHSSIEQTIICWALIVVKVLGRRAVLWWGFEEHLMYDKAGLVMWWRSYCSEEIFLC